MKNVSRKVLVAAAMAGLLSGAAVLQGCAGDAKTSPASGKATLTAPQIADLEAGKWYVNVHTAANPGGEIRGQVKSDTMAMPAKAKGKAMAMPAKK